MQPAEATSRLTNLFGGSAELSHIPAPNRTTAGCDDCTAGVDEEWPIPKPSRLIPSSTKVISSIRLVRDRTSV